MRKLAIAAAFASTILATPAVARDGSMYVGIEGGAMIVEDMDLDYADEEGFAADAITVDHRVGYDVGILGGYDFGMFRLEVEGAHKRAAVDQLRFTPDTDILPGAGAGVDADGRVAVTSAMVNALLDIGDDEGWRGYVGGGIGAARVKQSAATDDNVGFSASDSALAWQAIAGFSAAVTPNLDAGLKYRYFNTRRLDFGDSGAADPFDLGGKFRSHSLLASLVYNLWTPPPPPPPVVAAPPPPPPPATQTCPDGSVILTTDVCPVPPPPPPPPPPTEERG